MGAQQSAAPGTPTTADPGAPVMRAWVMESSGDVSRACETVNIAVPDPEPGDVRVRVMAAGLNYSDVKRAGQVDMPSPFVMGLDGAGIIDAVGAEVQGLARGDRVYFHCDPARPFGTLAEYTIAPAGLCFPCAKELAWEHAAALPCAAWTAYIALHDRLRASSGATVLVTGGAGGVGGFAVALAKLAGLRIAATCSNYNADWVRSRGAELVVDYTAPDWTEKVLQWTNGAGVDCVIDTVDARSAERCIPLLRFGGELCSVNGALGHCPALVRKGISVHYVYLTGLYHAAKRNPNLRQLLADTAARVAALATGGQLPHNVGEVGRWDSTRDALLTLKGRHLRGKLVIDVSAIHRDDQGAAAEDPAQDQAEEPAPALTHTEVMRQAAAQGSRYYVPPQYIQHVEDRRGRATTCPRSTSST
eukprot:TRINITY_DN12558_c0_g1_i2.p1 TRINITY_DN12558_c0_g1~~TRINITY_DN12558_c0_g1_i2.p1  ORF type:complete len:455 (+),score=128.03 TRINITY_DN12558_c0_g1_i2:113-1366(+)